MNVHDTMCRGAQACPRNRPTAWHPYKAGRRVGRQSYSQAGVPTEDPVGASAANQIAGNRQHIVLGKAVLFHHEFARRGCSKAVDAKDTAL